MSSAEHTQNPLQSSLIRDGGTDQLWTVQAHFTLLLPFLLATNPFLFYQSTFLILLRKYLFEQPKAPLLCFPLLGWVIDSCSLIILTMVFSGLCIQSSFVYKRRASCSPTMWTWKSLQSWPAQLLKHISSNAISQRVSRSWGSEQHLSPLTFSSVTEALIKKCSFFPP